MLNAGKTEYVIRVDEINRRFGTASTAETARGAFLESLERMTPDDLAPAPPPDKNAKKQRIFDILRYSVMAVCSIIFFVCAFYILNSLYEYKKADKYYGDMAEGLFDEIQTEPTGHFSFVSRLSESSKNVSLYNYDSYLKNLGINLPAVSITDGAFNIYFERVKAKLLELQEQNSDIMGWIKIDGTNVNYPMVRGKDNVWYLDHAPNGEYFRVGSIFVDYRCSKDIGDNSNTVIYGHNMANESMFSQVNNFLRYEDFFRETNIVIYTLDGVYTYEPFAAFHTKAYVQYFKTDFPSGEDFVTFAQTMQDYSLWKKDMTFSPDDKLITLSTCDNITDAGRYAVHAKLVSIER